MADRSDREYDRDPSQWRERDEENRRNRSWESEGGMRSWGEGSGEFGGTTRRGWGRNMEYDPDQERWSGRGGEYGRGGWQGAQQDDYGQGYGQGRGYTSDRDMYNQGYGQTWRTGQGSQDYGQGGQGFGRRYGQQGRRGPRMGQRGTLGYDTSFGRGSQNWQPPAYGRGRQGQPSSESWPGQYAGQDWQDYEMETDYFEDTPVTYTYTEYWLIPGPFSGVGPEDYTRTPERLREDIIQRLTQHGQVNAANIQVEVNDNCEVTLKGEVDDRQSKRLAEDMAESVWGINDVHNQLKVRSRSGRRTGKQGSQGQNQGTGQSGQQSGQQSGEQQGAQRNTSRTRTKS